MTTGVGELRATWDAPPISNDERLTGYTVIWTPSNRLLDLAFRIIANLLGARTDGYYGTADTSGTAYAIRGLKSSIFYKVEVYARNDAFRSDPATATAMPAPGPPQDILVTPGDGELHLAWQLPDDGRESFPSSIQPDAVYTYQVHWKPLDSNAAPATATTGDLAYSLTGLTNDRDYVFKVLAINDGGAGEYSEEQIAAPVPAGRPGAPRNVAVTAGIFTITATWEPPPGGADAYSLRWKPAGGTFAPAVTLAGAVHAHAVEGQEENTAYKVQVAAVNSAGIGAYSPEKHAATKEAVFKLDVNDDGAATAADGILILRYLLGVRGPGLIAGQAHASVDTVENLLRMGVREEDSTVKIVTEDGAPAQWYDGFEVAKFLLGITPETEGLAAKLKALTAD